VKTLKKKKKKRTVEIHTHTHTRDCTAGFEEASCIESYSHKERNSANNLRELGSNLSPV